MKTDKHIHRMQWKMGGRANMVYPDWNDLMSREYYLLSQQGGSTNLGSNIQLPDNKTFYIDTLILNNESATLKALVIFTLTSTTSSPMFAVTVPETDTVVLTGLVGLHTSTASVLWYQVNNQGIFSVGACVGGWLVDSPEVDYRTTTRVTKIH